MERDWPKWSYLYVVIATIVDEMTNELVTAAYVNGIRSMTFEETPGYEATFALSETHIDFMDMFGEAGWELVSHDVLATNVVLNQVTYPEMKHFFVFKREWTEGEEVEKERLGNLFEEMR